MFGLLLKLLQVIQFDLKKGPPTQSFMILLQINMGKILGRNS